MKKKMILWVLAGALAAGCLTGCQSGQTKETTGSVGLDPNNPVSLTVWHYYNGAQQAAFDALVADFNATKGKEQGVYVEGYSQGSVADLEKAVSDAAAGKVGSQELPDIFSSYADTAYAVQQQGLLADLTAYFTEDELSEYVDAYVEEGYFGDDGGLYLFPVAKSTEIMMMNMTDWEPFAEATGTTVNELATTEGVAQVAKRYYEWTDAQTPDVPDDGKAFYGRDSMSNYFVIGMKQMGFDIFDVEDGKMTLQADEDALRRLWENYYVPFVNGYFASIGKFRSDDVKTGDVLAYTGSSSSATYFPDQVVLDDETRPINYAILPVPVMEGGSQVNVQQGAGMAVTKSDEQHEYAASVFLKWFTARENNLRFVCESAYLPVRKDANSVEALDAVIAENNLTVSDKAYDCLVRVLERYDTDDFYATKCFENGYAARKVLDYNLSDKAKADREAIEAQMAEGVSREEAVAPYVTEEAFKQWYAAFVQALNEAAYK